MFQDVLVSPVFTIYFIEMTRLTKYSFLLLQTDQDGDISFLGCDSAKEGFSVVSKGQIVECVYPFDPEMTCSFHHECMW